jgi:hypothetical protein
LNHPIRILAAAAALAALTGCPSVQGALGTPTIPGMSTAPGPSTATPGPAATTMPTTPAATATPAPAATSGAGLGTAEDCKRELGEYDTGTAKLGKFENQRLPKGWVAAYNSEAEVYKGIDALFTNDWPCFQKFYPGAAGLYKTYKGI